MRARAFRRDRDKFNEEGTEGEAVGLQGQEQEGDDEGERQELRSHGPM